MSTNPENTHTSPGIGARDAQVERFFPVIISAGPDDFPGMHPHEDGGYVLATDFESVRQERDALRDAVEDGSDCTYVEMAKSLREDRDDTTVAYGKLMEERDRLRAALGDILRQVEAMLDRSETFRKWAENEGDHSDGEKHARVSGVLKELKRLGEAFAARAALNQSDAQSTEQKP